MKILFAEDTKDLSRAVCAVLSHEGFDMDPVYDGAEALEHIMKDSYDGIVLDIMMPKMDGIQVLKEVRSRGIVTPVLMLTAKAEVDDRVEGLDSGADDYLTKPFAMKELVARIKAMTRRRTQYTDAELSFGDLTLSPDSFELKCENTIRLSIKEFELLQALILNRNNSLETSWLLEHVWAGEEDAGADTVWLYISYLNGKLRSVASSVSIEGSKGSSFRLSPEEVKV